MGRILSLMLSFAISSSLVALLLGAECTFTSDCPATSDHEIRPIGDITPPESERSYHLPLPVLGTSLVAEYLVCYEGPYLEDGSDEPVSNVMALMIRNCGEDPIVSGSIFLERGKECFQFQFTHILPGMSVMILESEGKMYAPGAVSACYGWTKSAAEFCSMSVIQIEPIGMGTIQVTNISNETLENINLLHKQYLPEGLFIGGITYKTAITGLPPGETILLNPSHYANGYSMVIYMEKAALQ